jgi:SAM-dependent methyltransferase
MPLRLPSARRTASCMSSARQQASLLEQFVAAGRHENSVYGHQWGYPLHEPWLRNLVQEWLLPGVARSPVIAEIGVGGGRWVEFYADRVQRAYLIDGTPAAETAVRRRWSGPFEFIVSADGSLPAIPDGAAGYVWSFDTFVHFPCELADAYIREVARILQPGGVFQFNFAHKPAATQEHDGSSYIYRELEEVASVLNTAGLYRTERTATFGGWGSLLVEAVRE